jgi:divalent metal cation (Fe/Co/Zn/Cd) transporter
VVQTHLEPLAEVASGEQVAIDETAVAQAVADETGSPPRELRFVRTDDGIVAFLTLGLGAEGSLADAHGRASAVEERVRSAVPEIADVVVHTEP